MYKQLVLMGLLSLSAAVSAARTDPTQPVVDTVQMGVAGDASVAKVAEEAKFLLSAIFYSNAKKVVVINGEFKKEGDPVGAYQVLKIVTDKVYLNKGRDIKVLEFSDPILKEVEQGSIK